MEPEKKITNADEILFRSSALGNIMGDGDGITDKQSKLIEELSKKKKITEKQADELDRLIKKRDNPKLPDTCKTHLIDLYVSEVYGRREEAKGKQIEKGNERENDSITLVSRITKTFFKKNEIHLKNKFIKGTPDLYEGESIYKAIKTRDTKTMWSAHTFFRAKHKPVDKDYDWQGDGYMWLTGAQEHTVDLCLVNGTEKAINDEKRVLSYAMNVIDPYNDEAYKARCKQIEINHIVDLGSFINDYPHFDFNNDVSTWCYDIPMTERHHAFVLERKEEDILKIKKRVTECREWMNKNLFKVA